MHAGNSCNRVNFSAAVFSHGDGIILHVIKRYRLGESIRADLRYFNRVAPATEGSQRPPGDHDTATAGQYRNGALRLLNTNPR